MAFNPQIKIISSGPYCPEFKFGAAEIRTIKAPKKVPAKKKLLEQTPVGMANDQTSAKFIPVAHKKKKDKI